MRNDARDDDFDNVPRLSAKEGDDDDFAPATPADRGRTTVYSRTTPVVKVKGASTGPLWALVGALGIALVGLGWWSFQQISLMEQQLVATQESFARISEEAAGRLRDISGKVVATESSATSGSEQLKLEIKQLQAQLLDQGRAQQGVAGQQGDLGKRIDQALAVATAQQAANDQVQAQLKSLSADVATLKGGQADAGKLDAQIKAVAADVAALKKQGNVTGRLDSVEQDLVVLKSEVENRPAPAAATNTAEFDSFRGQTTRNITTLQSQIQNLQQQINTRQ
ncbi:ATPase [Pseudomonas silvicola]|nr:ATPase [Pseudomonas silvicola]